jgi:hypothetical protein
MRDIATEMIDLQQGLEKDSATWASHCQEVAQYVFPRQDEFFKSSRTEGEKRMQKIVDPTACLALEKFAAAMESMLTPRSSKWHGLRHPDDRINEDQEASKWYDDLTDVLFSLRYSPRANFASQQHENYMSLGAFGSNVLAVEEMPGRGILYRSHHIAEHFFMENAHGKIDRDWRKYKLTAMQAMEKFGEECPPAIKKAAEKEPNTKFDFLHCVIPNDERNPYKEGKAGWAFSSYHISFEGKKLLARPGGYRSFPFMIGRYVTAPGEIRGRSVAMTALPEIKMLNEQRKTDLRARHKAISPPHLAADPHTVRKVNLAPDHINYGMLDANGNPLIRPYGNDARIELANDTIMQSREFINDAFLVTLFQILVDSPQMTATEVLQRAQEKGALLSPTMGRQQSEYLGPMIEREISILDAHGYFTDEGPLPMPQIIKDAKENSEDDIMVEYSSPLSRMQKTEEALGTERTIQSLIPLAQFVPDILDNVDFDQYVDIIGTANGAPAKLFKKDEDKQATRDSRAQQQQMAMMAEAAPSVAGSIKDIAQAQSFSQQ